MKATIYISGRVTKDETLVDVIRQYKSFDDVTEVEVNINSNGGNKEEGEDVYNYLKNIDATIPVTTKAKKAYSIAAKIFAAGSTRIVPDEENVIGVHFARVTPSGDVSFTAEQLEELTDQLFEIKQEFIDFYSEHLDIDKVTVEALLENETILSGQRAVDLGFATQIETTAEIVAELSGIKLNSNKSKMTQKKKTHKSFFKGLVDQINAFLSEEEVVAELTLQDSSGSEIVFPDVENDALPMVGSKATLDGATIPDGEYMIPSMEDQTIVFAGGEVTEIKPKEESAPEETETVAEGKNGKKKKTEVTAEEVLVVSTWKYDVINTSFAEGDTILYNDWEGTEQTLSNSEFILSDGRSVVTDASGVIVKIKEAGTDVPETGNEPTPMETEAEFEKALEKLTKKVTAQVTASFEKKLAEKDKELLEAKRRNGSQEITAEQEENTGSENEKLSGASRYLAAARKLK